MNSSSIKLLKANDSFVNLITNLGTGTDRLQQTFHTVSGFYGYQELASMYEGWLGRRICDLIPEEALKRGFDIECSSWEPEKLTRLKRYIDKLKLHELMLGALKSERVFGGSIIVALTNATWGAMKNPIPDFLPDRSLLRLQMFDAWQAYAAEVNLMNPLTDDYLYPETYTIGSAGMSAMKMSGSEGNIITGAIVHNSRIERFNGEWLPWYERQRNMYWGQSVLSIAYEAIRNAGIVDSSVASLLFRASVPVMKVKDLINIVADPEAKAAFMERMNLLNYQMSNNNMAIVDSEEELTNLESGTLTGLDTVIERFYVLVSAATGIPVTKLVGESARGLNATGEGDLSNYYDMLESYQNNRIKPHLMEILKRWIIPSYLDELMPSDFNIVFPKIERESAKEKQESDSLFLDMLDKAVNSDFIDKDTARREIVERKIFKNFTMDDVDRMAKEKQENEVELTDAMDLAEEIYKQENEE
jgi:hypothetical protein